MGFHGVKQRGLLYPVICDQYASRDHGGNFRVNSAPGCSGSPAPLDDSGDLPVAAP